MNDHPQHENTQGIPAGSPVLHHSQQSAVAVASTSSLGANGGADGAAKHGNPGVFPLACPPAGHHAHQAVFPPLVPSMATNIHASGQPASSTPVAMAPMVPTLSSFIGGAPTAAGGESPWVVKSWGEMNRIAPEDPSNLLGNGFLRVGGALVLAGRTSDGKSALAMMCCAYWTLGLPVFGIKPSRPLRILVVQAENDDGDMAEMRDDIIRGMRLNQADTESVRNNIQIVTDCSSRGGQFIVGLAQILAREPFDLLVVDPLFAFFGGSVGLQQEVSEFLRSQINPLLVQFECGALIVHHMNKPPLNKKMALKGLDAAYALSGSAEIANWARAIFVLSAVNEDGIYELAAAKRGKKLGWAAEPGRDRVFKKTIKHSKQGIFWVELSPKEVARIREDKAGAEDVLNLIPSDRSIPKKVIITEAKSTLGIGGKKADELIATLENEGRIHRVEPVGDNKKAVFYQAFPRKEDAEEEANDEDEDDDDY